MGAQHPDVARLVVGGTITAPGYAIRVRVSDLTRGKEQVHVLEPGQTLHLVFPGDPAEPQDWLGYSLSISAKF